MSQRRSRPTRPNLFLSAVIVLAMSPLFEARLVGQDASSLPPGSSSPLVASKCLSCHGADLILQQRLSRAGWIREIDKMIRWGAPMTESERDASADYLAASTSAEPGTATSRNPDTVALIERRCLTCHGIDIVEQQRLGRPGWVREVDKMIRWGAAVADSEKDSLIDYLTSTFGPRKSR